MKTYYPQNLHVLVGEPEIELKITKMTVYWSEPIEISNMVVAWPDGESLTYHEYEEFVQPYIDEIQEMCVQYILDVEEEHNVW